MTSEELSAMVDDVLTWCESGNYWPDDAVPYEIKGVNFEDVKRIDFKPPAEFLFCDGCGTPWQPLRQKAEAMTMNLWLNKHIYACYTVVRGEGWAAVHRSDHQDYEGDLVYEGGWNISGSAAFVVWLIEERTANS